MAVRISYTPHVLPPYHLPDIFNVFVILDLGLPICLGQNEAGVENPALLQGGHLRPRWPWLPMCGVERGTELICLLHATCGSNGSKSPDTQEEEPNSKNTSEVSFSLRTSWASSSQASSKMLSFLEGKVKSR